jgi:hypothetical protein
MTVVGQNRKSAVATTRSAFPPTSDSERVSRRFRLVPTSDIPHADRLNKSRPWAALNSILSIGDQAAIKAGFGFRRWAALADNDF